MKQVLNKIEFKLQVNPKGDIISEEVFDSIKKFDLAQFDKIEINLSNVKKIDVQFILSLLSLYKDTRENGPVVSILDPSEQAAGMLSYYGVKYITAINKSEATEKTL